MLGVGEQFPDFSVTATVSLEKGKEFKTITGKDYAGKWKVYFFWPKDFTFVCPTEIAAFGKLNKEFADRDAPPNPIQLARDEPLARELFPLGERLESAPWLGRRPCLPDMVPVIGRGERHHGLWFAFGHAHHGFTLGPVTGRLLAELMTGETPFTDPSLYAAGRFEN